MFVNNVEAKNFNSTFAWCQKLNDIPGNLFDNNPEANDFSSAFSGCIKLTNIPWNIFQNINNNAPNRCYSLQESQYRGIFRGCTNAYNYSSIPELWKSW